MGEERRSIVVVDLSAALWLAVVDPLTRMVSAVAFCAAVEVSAR
jgi:hypothetical protein